MKTDRDVNSRVKEATHDGEFEAIYFTITPAQICEINLKCVQVGDLFRGIKGPRFVKKGFPLCLPLSFPPIPSNIHSNS